MDEGDDWLPLEETARAALAAMLQIADGARDVSAGTVRKKPLPFYKETALVRVRGGHPAAYYLYRSNAFTRLEGSGVPILEANDREPIALSEDNVLAYLRFFCRFVHGPDGPFTLVDDARPLSALREKDEAAYAALEKTIRPPVLQGRGEDGTFLCEAYLLYGRDFFKSRFAVKPSGHVDMQSGELVQEFVADKESPPP